MGGQAMNEPHQPADRESTPGPIDVSTEGTPARATRYRTLVKWVIVGLIALSVFVILQRTPVRLWLEGLESWIENLGLWGKILFALFYVAAVVLVLPAWPFTIAAG